ncbi:MAG TPA: hypothetical protein VHE53_04090 [Patescibacteria group bacterium]|nr:hypothetical protein [Patescibacteria group bacterium]
MPQEPIPNSGYIPNGESTLKPTDQVLGTDLKKVVEGLNNATAAIIDSQAQGEVFDKFLGSPVLVRKCLESPEFFPDSIFAIVVCSMKPQYKESVINIIRDNMDVIGANTRLDGEELAPGSDYGLVAVSELGDEDEAVKSQFFTERLDVLEEAIIRSPKHASLVGELAKYGDQEDLDWVKDYIASEISSRPNDIFRFYARKQLQYLLDNEDEGIQSFGADVADDVLARFNLSPRVLYDWHVSHTKETPGRIIDKNILALLNLEESRPGIATLLNEKFNISAFARYPSEFLIRQFDEAENTDLPYGIALFPRADNDGAFYDDVDPLEQLLDGLDGKYAVRVVEAEKKTEVARLLISLGQKYGANHKISFAIVGGHGSEDHIALGFKPNLIMQEDVNRPRAKRLNEFFEPNPIFILNSCSTGVEAGIAQDLSTVIPGARVTAPNIDTYMKKLSVDMSRGLSIDVEYEKEGIATTYVGGKKVN